MELRTLKSVVMKKQKGAFSSIVWEHDLDVRAPLKSEYIVTKRTRGIVRCGVEYDNIGAVKVDRQLGVLPTKNAGLQWGEWDEYPYFISHKGVHYLRVALVHGAKLHTEYRINGRLATKEQCIPLCVKSAFPSTEKVPEVLTIKAMNILAIR